MVEAAIAPALRVVGINKSYGLSKALSDVSFEVGRGRVHALVGENGAGKSTLVKIVTGIIEADSGEIFLGGAAGALRDADRGAPRRRRRGLSGPEALPASRRRREHRHGQRAGDGRSARVDRKAMYARAKAALGQLGVAVDPHALIAGLSVAELQFVEIARALTADLAAPDPRRADLGADAGGGGEALPHRPRPARPEGTSVMLITHRLEELDLDRRRRHRAARRRAMSRRGRRASSTAARSSR